MKKKYCEIDVTVVAMMPSEDILIDSPYTEMDMDGLFGLEAELQEYQEHGIPFPYK